MAEDVSAEAFKHGRVRQHLAPQDIPWSARIRVLFIWLVALALGTVLLVVPLPFSGQVALKVGDVAPADVVAPRQATFDSAIQTEKRREAAANAIPDVYDPPLARIARQQLTRANQILTFVNSVRSDSYADQVTKAQYLSAIKGLELQPAMIDRILTSPATNWDRIASEVQTVLDRSMREEITESTLADERRRVPALVRLDLSDEDAAIVSYVVQNLLVPNSFYNAAKTEERRQLARDRVEPVTATYERGEVILRAGDIVTEQDMEALNALGMRQSNWTLKDLRNAAAILLIFMGMLLYYLWRQEPEFWLSRSQPFLLTSMLLFFLIVARAMVPAHAVLAYVFPYAALTMMLSVLLNIRVAIVTTCIFTLLVGWLASGSVELMAYAFGGSLVGAVKLGRGEHMSKFPWAAVFVGLTNAAIIVAFRTAGGGLDLRGLAEMSLASTGNGLLTITIALFGSYLVGSAFGIPTPLQLMELSRPTHPLLRQLLLKAPGTYHHTLIVSNMAESAAEAIGADAQLARVGAYYHDVGKTVRPYFFAENHTEGMDPHANLDPYTSAQIIINHVREGVELARKYRLPQRIIDFIPEHHGTFLVSYFYHEATKRAGPNGTVERAGFAYPGPKPQTPETAITMIADCAEATVRAKHPTSVDEINEIVYECIYSRVSNGQLDECSLTLADLQAIQQAFVDVLRGIHHPRVTYPSELQPGLPAPAAPAPAQPEVSNVPVTPPQDATSSAT